MKGFVKGRGWYVRQIRRWQGSRHPSGTVASMLYFGFLRFRS